MCVCVCARMAYARACFKKNTLISAFPPSVFFIRVFYKMSGNRSRVDRDDYYTHGDLLRRIVNDMDQCIPNHTRRYFDFSAGDGRFAEMLANRSFTIAGQVDLFPQHASVSKEDFLSMEPKVNIDVIGLNPPFGKQGTLAKQFVRCAEQWNATFMVLILPARLRGTFWIHQYRVVHTYAIPPKSFFRPRNNHKRLTVPTSLWILEKRVDAIAKLATYVRPDVRTPEGVTMLPRTRPWNAAVNLAIRLMGARAGKDILFLQGTRWRVMRNGVLCDTGYDTPFETGWCLSVRPCGADFVLVETEWNDRVVQSFIQYLLKHPDPRGKECQPPTMRRSWLACLFRNFASS